MTNKIKDNAINMIEKSENKIASSMDKIEQILLLTSQLNDTLKTFKKRKDINSIDSEVWYIVLLPVVQNIQKLSTELIEINDINNVYFREKNN